MRVLWFRRDLRAVDNPLLSFAGEVLPIFIFDRDIIVDFAKDDRRFSFIYDALMELKDELKKIGLDILIFFAEPKDVFEFLKQNGARDVIASVDYDSYALKRDSCIESIIPFTRIYDSFLFTPEEILNKEGRPYRVFTPYYKSALKHLESKNIQKTDIAKPTLANRFEFDKIYSIKEGVVEKRDISLESINLKRASYDTFSKDDVFNSLSLKLPDYQKYRDFLALDATTKVGVHLRFGTIGIRELVRKFLKVENSATYIKELLWRDFYAQLLANFPHSEFNNFNQLNIEYENSEERFLAFTEAKTGVPIVDAGVVELKSTGYMHNRVRMIVASFLTKNLGISWKWGERFFKEYLLDYEASSNIGSWQWAAGCGADAQPYFRIFNPYLQTQKFDKECEYIKKWLPQLSSISAKNLQYEKWLFQNSIKNYPKPIVDIKGSKVEALRRVNK
ncbi:MAG: cryptochrome/photolyase family protein [Campylobacterales bacterium]